MTQIADNLMKKRLQRIIFMDSPHLSSVIISQGFFLRLVFGKHQACAKNEAILIKRLVPVRFQETVCNFMPITNNNSYMRKPIIRKNQCISGTFQM